MLTKTKPVTSAEIAKDLSQIVALKVKTHQVLIDIDQLIESLDSEKISDHAWLRERDWLNS